MLDLSRRNFLIGAGTATAGIIAAPAIVRAASLMPVRARPDLAHGVIQVCVMRRGVWQNVNWIVEDEIGDSRSIGIAVPADKNTYSLKHVPSGEQLVIEPTADAQDRHVRWLLPEAAIGAA